MTAFVLLAVLSGPPLNPPSLQLRIHCGGGFEGRVIRSEWSRQESYFISKRLEIQQHYRVTIDDDAFEGACYQIGRGGLRTSFRSGSFRASGCFMRALESICEIDQWERRSGDDAEYAMQGGEWAYFPVKPKPEAWP